jgi:hypothetical protein
VTRSKRTMGSASVVSGTIGASAGIASAMARDRCAFIRKIRFKYAAQNAQQRAVSVPEQTVAAIDAAKLPGLVGPADCPTIAAVQCALLQGSDVDILRSVGKG